MSLLVGVILITRHSTISMEGSLCDAPMVPASAGTEMNGIMTLVIGVVGFPFVVSSPPKRTRLWRGLVSLKSWVFDYLTIYPASAGFDNLQKKFSFKI